MLFKIPSFPQLPQAEDGTGGAGGFCLKLGMKTAKMSTGEVKESKKAAITPVWEGYKRQSICANSPNKRITEN